MPKAVEIKGAKELLRLLDELPRSVKRKINRRAVNLATTPILSAVREQCPEVSGSLKKAMIKKITNSGPRCNGIVGADENFIGPNGEMPSKYDHLVFYGHITPAGTATTPNPFLQRGWDESIDDAQEKYETVLATGIETEALKLGGG